MQLFSNILLVHRSNLFCEVLRESLEQRNYGVLSFSTNGSDALEKAFTSQPDLIIISNSLAELSGVELTERLIEKGFKGKTLFMSQDAQEAANLMLRTTVNGHIHLYENMSELFFAIQELAAGRSYTSRRVERQISLASKEVLTSARLDSSLLNVLTPREMQIMRALANSNTTPQIAEQFLISKATVNNHRANIRNKLKIKGRNQLLSIAISLKPFYAKEAS